ncbi:MAG: hypothetical protein JRF08_06305 [Deltaproteobacteria bacterium]|nr:hypothetical protein [Deltaproteobacteria bacterium]
MKRKKKRGRIEHPRNKKEEDRTLFDKPFKGLSEDLKVFDKRKEPVSPQSQSESNREKDDEDLFQSAMKDVIPLKDDKNKIIAAFIKEETVPELAQRS